MDCEACGAALDPVVPGACPDCGHLVRVSAEDYLAWLLPGAERPLPPAGRPDPLDWPGYDDARDRAAARSGADESVVVAVGRLRDAMLETVVVAWDFGFMGGSMGQVAGGRIAAAYDLARERGLPVVLLPSTGGARMQEGMTSLVQMAATTAAVQAHRDARLLQVTVVRDPTTGGVFASHANLADLVVAEAGATLGFAGPRVSEAMTGGPLPSGSHTAAGAAAAGLVDGVLPRPAVLDHLVRVLGWAAAARRAADDRPRWAGGEVAPTRTTGRTVDLDRSAWDEVAASRAPDRPRAPALLDHGDVDVAARLRGDRAGGVDPAVEVVLATWSGTPVVVVAMDPGGGAIGPAGYRLAWRGIDLASRLGVPVVTLVDTPGADASADAEAGGIAHHIAETLRRVLSAPVPVVALVVGEGGSGGALALAVGDRLLLQEHATFSVIAPEGAAAILHRDRSRAAEVAELLDPTARRLHDLGIADEVVPEPPGTAAVTTAVAAVAHHLTRLEGVDGAALAAQRLERWRRPLPDA